MRKNEIDHFQSAIRNHLVVTGRYSHVLVNLPYAEILKKELNCSEQHIAKDLNVKDLSIVDGLEKDFVIIP